MAIAYAKATLPHGIVETAPDTFDPTTATVAIQDIQGTVTEVALDVVGLKGSKGVYVDLQTVGSEQEDGAKIVAVRNRSANSDGTGGSVVFDPDA